MFDYLIIFINITTIKTMIYDANYAMFRIYWLCSSLFAISIDMLDYDPILKSMLGNFVRKYFSE